jgi:hypothetical protein
MCIHAPPTHDDTGFRTGSPKPGYELVDQDLPPAACPSLSVSEHQHANIGMNLVCVDGLHSRGVILHLIRLLRALVGACCPAAVVFTL